MDAWEGQGTPLRVTVDVSETLGTGQNGPTVSLSGSSEREGLSFAALGLGDGLEDSSTAFVADLDDANNAISALTVHTTAADGAVSASGVLSLGACDSGEWATVGVNSTSAAGSTDSGRAAWWDWSNGCREGGRARQNVTFGVRMGTMPVLESVWPASAPIAGGLTVEVRVLVNKLAGKIRGVESSAGKTISPEVVSVGKLIAAQTYCCFQRLVPSLHTLVCIPHTP